MSTIAISQNFNTGYKNFVSGSGAVTTSTDGNVLIATSPTGVSNAAMKQWLLPIRPGDEIEFLVLAKVNSGFAGIYIDLMQSNNTYTAAFDMVEFTNKDYQYQRIKVIVPLTADYTTLVVNMGCRNQNGENSEAMFMFPQITANTRLGVLQQLAVGVVRVDNGVASIHGDFRNLGVESVTYNDSTKDITIIISNVPPFGIRPIIQATASTDRPWTAIAGNWNDATRSFKVALSNGTEKMSLAAGSSFVFVDVKS